MPTVLPVLCIVGILLDSLSHIFPWDGVLASQVRLSFPCSLASCASQISMEICPTEIVTDCHSLWSVVSYFHSPWLRSSKKKNLSPYIVYIHLVAYFVLHSLVGESIRQWSSALKPPNRLIVLFYFAQSALSTGCAFLFSLARWPSLYLPHRFL